MIIHGDIFSTPVFRSFNCFLSNSLLRLAFLGIALSCGTTDTNAATNSGPAGGDLQAAINSAQGRDTIILQAGAVYIGNFTLPHKSASEYITIQSSAQLPAGRITPA